MPDVRSLLMQGNLMNRRSGLGGERNVAQWQQNVGRVSPDDLRELGVNTLQMDPLQDVDPEAMKFDAMMALKKAQRQGFGVERAKQRLDDASMAGAGVDEVLRRRQRGFNEYANKAQTGEIMTPGFSDVGGPNPTIAGQTGAAIASATRAGKPQIMPQAGRAFTGADARRAEHFGAQPLQQARDAMAPQTPFALTSADVNGDGFESRRQGAIDSAVAGLSRARGPGRIQGLKGRGF